jgi:hypothetical protein
MTFQMVNADKGPSQADRETLCSTVANEQRGEQPWTTRGGNAVNFGQRTPGALQDELDQRTDSRQMIPGSDFRDDPAVPAVQVDLAGYFGSQDLAGSSKERYGCLVTGSFERQHQRSAHCGVAWGSLSF